MNQNNLNNIGIGSENNILQVMNMNLFSTFRTNNPIIDGIILSIITILITSNVSKLINYLSGLSLSQVYYNGKYHLINLYNVLRGNQKKIKYVYVNAITDEKKPNELYDAVFWYITNTEIIDFTKELEVQFSIDNKLVIKDMGDLDDIKINKVIEKNKIKNIVFEGKIVSYMFRTEIMTVYADEERKKENRSVILSTIISKNEVRDLIDEFCSECIKKYSKYLKNKKWEPLVFHNSNGKWISKPLKSRRKIETIILPRKTKNIIMKDLEFFVGNKEWYNNIGVPYTRGYLFYGKPGCGKTSLIKGISNYSQRHIHYLILNDIKNDVELYNLLSSIDYMSTVLVIEDIDCASLIIRKREMPCNDLNKTNNDLNDNNNKNNGNNKQEITLSGLLNALDGINESEGRILIMTSNNPEILDDALIRPGRIDKKFLFDLCTQEQIGDLYKMFNDKECDQNILKTITENKYSPAYVSTLFMQYLDCPNEALLNFDSENNINLNLNNKVPLVCLNNYKNELDWDYQTNNLVDMRNNFKKINNKEDFSVNLNLMN